MKNYMARLRRRKKQFKLRLKRVPNWKAHVKAMKKTWSTYFTFRLNGHVYGCWRDWYPDYYTDTYWRYQIVDYKTIACPHKTNWRVRKAIKLYEDSECFADLSLKDFLKKMLNIR